MKNTWYVSSSQYALVPVWPANTSVAVGAICRSTTNIERIWICVVAGTTSATQPNWTNYQVQTGTVWWQEATGVAALNGDAANTNGWTAGATHLTSTIIRNVSGGSDTYFLCSFPGTSGGTEPAWNKTPGAATSDGTSWWYCIGPMINFTAPWAAPSPNLSIVDGAAKAGDTFFISNNHAESQLGFSTVLMTSGTPSQPSQYICVVDTTAPPTTLSNTATFTATTISAGNFDTVSYGYGLNFFGINVSGSGAAKVFENCSFTLNGASPGSKIGFGGGYIDFRVKLINCALVFSNDNQLITIGSNNSGSLTMVGGSIAATGAVPLTAFDIAVPTVAPQQILLRDVDLSALNGNLFRSNVGATYGVSNRVILENCKVNAGGTYLSSTLSSQYDTTLAVYNCASTSNNYTFYTRDYMGITQQETTIVRNGGASDGTTSFSWKLISSAYASYVFPLQSQSILIWNSMAGVSVTATIEIAGGSALDTRDLWVEFEYLSSSLVPLGSNISSKPGFSTTVTAITSSTASWSGSPANKQKLSLSFIPQMPGFIRAHVFLAKPGTTVYVDPYIDLGSAATNRVQFMIPGCGAINETAGGEYSFSFVG